ncbi:hypothetical protein ABFS83_07G090900 [Erythranthe nasuta]
MDNIIDSIGKKSHLTIEEEEGIVLDVHTTTRVYNGDFVLLAELFHREKYLLTPSNRMLYNRMLYASYNLSKAVRYKPLGATSSSLNSTNDLTTNKHWLLDKNALLFHNLDRTTSPLGSRSYICPL